MTPNNACSSGGSFYAAEVIDVTSEQEEEQEKPRAKSGAAAAAAIEAAKGDAAALKQRRATWKDPVVAAREAALQASAAAPPAVASPLSQQPSVVKAEGSTGPSVESTEADAAASPANKGRGTRAGRNSPQKRGRRGAKQTDKVIDKEQGDTVELNKQLRKRTRSGLVVDLEEI